MLMTGLEFKPWIPDFKSRALKTIIATAANNKKASTRMTSLSKGRSSYIAHMEVRMVFHVTVVWLSLSPIIRGESVLYFFTA